MSQWHAIVVEGGERDVRAFVAGFVADRKADDSSVVLGADVGLEPASLGARLRALVGDGQHVVLVAPALAAALHDALSQGGAAVGVCVTDRYEVASASCRFAAEVFSREVAGEIRAALGALPAGVRIEDREEAEEVRESDRGVELYAPAHDYTYRVRGRVDGELTGVLEVRRRLGAIGAVTLEALHLVEKS